MKCMVNADASMNIFSHDFIGQAANYLTAPTRCILRDPILVSIITI
jgi:hypothetical protein